MKQFDSLREVFEQTLWGQSKRRADELRRRVDLLMEMSATLSEEALQELDLRKGEISLRAVQQALDLAHQESDATESALIWLDAALGIKNNSSDEN